MEALEQPVTSPALRYHGAKFRLAPWIMQFVPEHQTYVEPFGGAAGILLQKPRSYAEVYNDLDGEIVRIQLTPYARAEFDLAWEETDDPIERARRIVIRAQMGFSSAGATKGVTGFRIDTRRAYGTAQHLWLEYPDAVAAAGQRFSGVLIENRPATEVLLQHDAPDTLHFVDPPYVHSTRVRPRSGGYKHEMTDADHRHLLGVLLDLQGMVIVCGYDSDLYSDMLAGWERFETAARISAGRGAAIRTEVAWINPACAAALDRRQHSLFGDEE